MVYLYDQSTAPGGLVRFKTILERVRERLPLSTLFRRRLARVPLDLDYPYWIEDPDFDLEYHVRHIALPAPGDWRQLCIQLSRLHSRALNLARPPWEMYVIEGLDRVDFLPAGAFAVMIKVHHAAIDDATESDFTAALHDADPDRPRKPPRDQWHPESEPNAGQLMTLAWFNTTTKLIETGQSLWERLPLVGGRGRKPGPLLHGDDAPAPRTRFDAEVSPYRAWNARFFDLEDVQRIAAAVPGADVDDVALAVIGGAMTRYLDHLGEAPDGSLHALVPVHVHEPSGPNLPGHRVLLLRVNLATRLSDPLARLDAIAAATGHARGRERDAEADLRDAEAMDELQDSLPSPTMALLARAVEAGFGPGKHYREDQNTIVSHVDGPGRPVYFCGARLVGFTGMGAVVDNLALNHTVTTCDGRLTIAATCDRELMRRPNFYGRCMEGAFEELAGAAEAAKTPRRRRRA
jgi:WS/DGAT/MGAT family acyltransferase